jgi:hypothetical protein
MLLGSLNFDLIIFLFVLKNNFFKRPADGDPVPGIHFKRQTLEHSDQPGRRHTSDHFFDRK